MAVTAWYDQMHLAGPGYMMNIDLDHACASEYADAVTPRALHYKTGLGVDTHTSYTTC